MKKLLGILVLAFLFSGNANAGVNEPGWGSVAMCEFAFNQEHTKLKKIYREKDKKINVVLYGSCNDNGNYGFGSKKGKNLESLHKKTYKVCLKYAKKYTPGEDCYLYAVNGEVVWKYDAAKAEAKAKVKLAKAKVEEAEAKAEQEKQKQIDTKPGRFFEDQPDVNDDYQIHIIYLLTSDTKDNERDLNGWIEQQVKKIDDYFFKLTGKKQRLKLDKRSDGKLDVTFVRLDRKSKKGGWNMSYPDYYLTKNGFDNPKKTYLSFTDAVSGDDGQMGVHHGYIFIGGAKSDMARLGVHELLHGLGFATPCTKGVTRGAHLNSGILGQELQGGFGKAVYNHGDPTCPDLKDAIYLTPTSDDPFDPLPIFCNLAQKKRGNPPGNFVIPARYTHKKLIEGRADEWCTYKLNEYASESWFSDWGK